MSEERPHTVPSQPAPDPASGTTGGFPPDQPPAGVPPRSGRGPRPGSALRQPVPPAETAFTPEQRLLVLDAWRRSGLPAGDFAPLVGLSRHTLYAWKKRFDDQGPAGLADRPKGAPAGSKLPELTRRTILMLKEV